MHYKVYNELPGVGTTAKTLISEIYYNVYNMMEWRHHEGANGTGRNIPSVPTCRHQDEKKRAANCLQPVPVNG